MLERPRAEENSRDARDHSDWRLGAVTLVTVPHLDSQPAFQSAASERSFSIETPRDPEQLRAYQRNMVEVVRKHPGLLELVRERSALAERYQAARNAEIEGREARRHH